MRKFRPKSPPVAMPFRRGSDRRAPAPARRTTPPAAWIAPGLFAAFTTQVTDAHRVATESEAWLERLGDDLLLSYQTERARDAMLGALDDHCRAWDFAPRRVFGKDLPTQVAERDAPTLLRGDAAVPMETEVREAGVRYGLDFAAGYSAGFFIDQRANRSRLRVCAPRRLLNTFAYTCSFSVVAALGGAETVSVDLSRRSLTRGEENFRRNGLDPKTGHKFIADDVLAVLPRLARRGEKFDAIVLDPPTFSRNQAGDAFQVRRDFDKLVLLALEVAAPGAMVLLSVNHSAMRVADLEIAGRHALKLAGRAGKFITSEPLPDFPPGHGAKTVWLEVR
jgi:23S rRNA (cytosine1962-C5)-methyltransferase